jgi:hypothetical protein
MWFGLHKRGITLPASGIAIAALKLYSSCPAKQPVIGPSEKEYLLHMVKFISHFIIISVNRYILSICKLCNLFPTTKIIKNA